MMDLKIAPIVIELLPEIGEQWGIFLQRSRIILIGDEGNKITLLGAGISLSRETARAKAVSEAMERLIIHPMAISLRKDKPILINGTIRQPFIDMLPEPFHLNIAAFNTISSACHVTREEALKEAAVEMVERLQLRRWCCMCEDLEEVLLARVDLFAEAIPSAVRDFLLTKPMLFVLSWCKAFTAIPFLICLAFHNSYEYFYATAAASLSVTEAIKKVLLDCAKMMLFEDYSAIRGAPLHFRNPAELLPLTLRNNICPYLAPIDLIEFEEKYCLVEQFPLKQYGLEHCVPWPRTIDYHIISILSKYQGTPSSLLRCFH